MLALPLFPRSQPPGDPPPDPCLSFPAALPPSRAETAAFRVGQKVSAGKTYPVCSSRITPVQLAEEYEQCTGEKTRVQRLSMEEVRQAMTGIMGEGAAIELIELFRFVRPLLISSGSDMLSLSRTFLIQLAR